MFLKKSFFIFLVILFVLFLFLFLLFIPNQKSIVFYNYDTKRNNRNNFDISELFFQRNFTVNGYPFERITRYDIEMKFINNSIFEWIFLFPEIGANHEKHVLRKINEITDECHLFNKKFIDIGANAGIYSVFSELKGCQTDSWDPQPSCCDYIKINAFINDLEKIKIYNNFLLNEEKEIYLQDNDCEGTFKVKENLNSNKKIKSVIFDKFYKNEDILLIKIDTEGNEILILKSMLKVLQKNRIRHMIIELTPPWWKDFDINIEEGIDILNFLLKNNYELFPCELDKRLEECFDIKTRSDIEKYVKMIGQTDLYVKLK